MATAQIREIIEGLQAQGEAEKVPYRLTTTPWGAGTPSGVVITAWVWKEATQARGADVTTTLFPINSPTLSDGLIVLSFLESVTAGIRYRIEMLFVLSGTTFEAIAFIDGEL